FTKDEVLVAADLDFEPGVRWEQHSIAFCDVAHGWADRDHFGPRESPVQIRGCGNEDAAPALAVAGVLVGEHEQTVGRHANRLFDVVGVGHAPQNLPVPASGTAPADG